MNRLLIAAAVCAALGAVAATPEQDALAPAKDSKQTQQAKQNEKVIISAGQMPRVDGAPVTTATEPAAKPFKGLFSQSWVHDEDAKDKNGPDGLAYR